MANNILSNTLSRFPAAPCEHLGVMPVHNFRQDPFPPNTITIKKVPRTLRNEFCSANKPKIKLTLTEKSFANQNRVAFASGHYKDIANKGVAFRYT